MKPEEFWAQRIVSVTLGVEVYEHDDNTADSMYDLRVGPAEAPTMAIEVVGAVDQEWTETWNVGPGRSGKRWDVAGNWMLTIQPGTHVKTLKRELPPLLRRLEAMGVRDFDEQRLRSRRALGDARSGNGSTTTRGVHPRHADGSPVVGHWDGSDWSRLRIRGEGIDTT